MHGLHLRTSGYSSENGQILLIVVLVMVIALTVGLSVVSRSIIHVKTSSEEIDSQKAFSAAEAGIEEGLQNPGGSYSNQKLGNNALISNVSVNSLGNAKSFQMNNGESVHQDNGGDVWLTTYNSDPTKIVPNPSSVNLTIDWGDSSYGCGVSGDQAALEIIVLTEPSAGNFSEAHYAYDPCTLRASANNFNNLVGGPGSVGGVTYKNEITISGITNGLFTRVIPLYSDTVIGIKGNIVFPSQGTVIASTGQAGNTLRKVTLFQAYESLPAEFFYTLFSH